LSTSPPQPVVDRTTNPTRHGHHAGIALAVVLTCQLMVGLDATVVNIALPRIQSGLSFSSSGLAWVFNAYTLTFGGLLLLGGRAGDILGRRRVFIGGVAVFTVASLLCGLATESWWLVAARALQGIGGAFASPSVLALIATTFPDERPRTKALSLFSAVGSGSFALGMVLGGVLTSIGSWRWVFFINVPIGAAVCLLANRFLAETQRHRGATFDIGGALTGTLGMGALVYGFLRGSSSGWSDGQAVTAFGAAAVLLATFFVLEVRAEQPIVPLRLFADRNRSAAYLCIALLPAAMFGMFFLLVQYVQDGLGYSALRAGLAFLPMSVTMFGTVRLLPRLVPRIGLKPPLLAGGVTALGAFVWLSQMSAGSSYFGYIFGPLAMVGLGMGMCMLPLSMTILRNVAPRESGAAAGLLQTMQWVGGGSVGLAVMVTISTTAGRHAARHIPAGLSTRLRSEYSLVHGMTAAFTLSIALICAMLLVSVFVLRARPTEAAAEPVDSSPQPTAVEM
jgi:EmrB/QacA subfamily drug resistance transporter